MEPQKRIETLQRFGERLTNSREVKQTWQKWGMELESQPKSLTGRLLPPEPVYLKNPQKPFSYPSNNADWTNGKSILNITECVKTGKGCQRVALKRPHREAGKARAHH